LDKADRIQQNLYYSLLKEAKVFVNTTPQWGGFSAMIEAMHFYVPVVITPYGECVTCFGKKIEFGYYVENNSVEELCCRLRAILGHMSYESLCRSAHEAVKGHTWNAFVDQMLQHIDLVVMQNEAAHAAVT
jgi:glycosyltransferase involved in cell wall biosynthesis